MDYRDFVKDYKDRLKQTGKPLWVGHPVFSDPAYGGKHPLSIPRLQNVLPLISALDLDQDPRQFVVAPIASPAQLQRYHTIDYVQYVLGCETQPRDIEKIRRYNVGTAENPVFPGLLTRAGAACGGAIAAAEALAESESGLIFCPGSGAHHAGQHKASSFCYFNDPVLALLKMQDHGLKRIAYVDIDAHPGDGVEKPFRGFADILTMSLHQAYGQNHRDHVIDPKSGRVNIVMPSGAGDDAYQQVMDAVVLPVLTQFKPEAIVLQAGCDAIAEDPLSTLSMSNSQYWQMIDTIRDQAPRVLVTGGGGYHPWSVARAWTGAWATLNDVDPHIMLPHSAQRVLAQISHPGFRTEADRHPDRFERWCQFLHDDENPGIDMPGMAELGAVIRASDFSRKIPDIDIRRSLHDRITPAFAMR